MTPGEARALLCASVLLFAGVLLDRGVEAAGERRSPVRMYYDTMLSGPATDADSLRPRGTMGVSAADGAIVDRASNDQPAETRLRVALNEASARELERLPGIGPSIAARIIEYRARYGGFTNVRELTAVKGIGPRKFEAIEPHVELSSEAL